MKPTSIIFMIVAVLLVIGGLITVGVARQYAAAEGIELTDRIDTDSEAYLFTYEYDADSIAKIAIDVKNTRVNIIGGAAKPYIELINFADGMYEFSSANRNLIISNNTDITSITGIASAAMNFKGLRSLINYYNISGLEKTVNIYLCSEYPVNVIDCHIARGDVEITGGNTATDYNIEIEKGNLTVDGVTTSSALNAIIGAGDVNIASSVIGTLDAEIEKGNMTSDARAAKTAVTIQNGDFSYTYGGSVQDLIRKLFTNVGVITLDGIAHGGYVEYTDLPSYYDTVHVSIGSGDITINSAS